MEDIPRAAPTLSVRLLSNPSTAAYKNNSKDSVWVATFPYQGVYYIAMYSLDVALIYLSSQSCVCVFVCVEGGRRVGGWVWVRVWVWVL